MLPVRLVVRVVFRERGVWEPARWRPAGISETSGPLSPQCQIIYPRQQLLTLRELEMIGFIENNVSKLSLLLSEISRCALTSLLSPAGSRWLW